MHSLFIAILTNCLSFLFPVVHFPILPFPFFDCQDVVKGVVVVSAKGRLSHSGIKLVLEGNVALQLSAKSVGLFEAFYNSVKPIQLVFYAIDLGKSGSFETGDTEIPFEFKLEPLTGQTLFETYHGVFVNIQYLLRVDMQRPLLAKALQKSLEFIVEIKVSVMTQILTVNACIHTNTQSRTLFYRFFCSRPSSFCVTLTSIL